MFATGYVHELINKNLDFNGFVWGCARAFGALITLRDEPMGTEIPEELKPSFYHSEKLVGLRKELAAWSSMSDMERKIHVEKDRQQQIGYHLEQIDKDDEAKNLIMKMTAAVTQWSPPTPDHVRLREFMLEQLAETECGREGYHEDCVDELGKKSTEVLCAERYSKLLTDIAYHVAEDQKECERTRLNNEWLKKLRESVGPPPKK